MYSSLAEKLFKKQTISVGDRIQIICEKGTFEGLLMPRSYESDILVLKLDNGYNIGISAKNAQIKLITKEHKKPTALPPETHRGDIAILGCGGTIASKVEYKTGAVYPTISPQELRRAFPSLDQLGTIHARQLFSLFSEDMNTSHWAIVADAIAKEIKEGVQGVVLMHGTDMMHYTSAAVSFMLQDLPVPVIFVGSQRSSDRPSSDNEMNLLNAVYTARQNIGEVGIVMHASTNDDVCYLHRGVRARKLHTSRRDAFQSINCSPLAEVDYSKKQFTLLTQVMSRNKDGLTQDTRVSDNVAMVYTYPGIKPDFIKKLDNYDGIVLLGTGLGHVSVNPFNDKSVHSLLPALKDLISSDIPVVMAPQTIFGRINMNIYSTGRVLLDAGVIGNECDWTPETAYVKLCWVLGHTKNMKKIKEEMLTNMVGEISERSNFE